MKNIIRILVILVSCSAQIGLAEEPPAGSPEVKANMDLVYQSFKGLQKFMFNRDSFLDPANEKEIGERINGVRAGIHRVGLSDTKYQDDPGFVSTLKVLNDMLSDARNRFFEGKKGYALWRLKTSANYCVSCHTRHEVPVEFTDPDTTLPTLNAFEAGEFYLASRQFEKAQTSFMKAVLDPSLSAYRMDALRKWLVVHVRVHPDPQAAILQLNKLRPRAQFTRYEEEEIIGWLESLRRWQNEGPMRVPPMAKAENLIRQGLGMNDPLSRQKGTVELLRASALLHSVLEGKGAKLADRGHALYLLGLAYNELPFFFVNELPELFLEQCIRENPGTDDAKRAFNLYREIVTLGYTGSGGTRIPDDVQLDIRELNDLAYGVPQIKGKV